MTGKHRWNDTDRLKQKNSNHTLSTSNLTRSGLGLNPAFCGERSANNSTDMNQCRGVSSVSELA